MIFENPVLLLIALPITKPLFELFLFDKWKKITSPFTFVILQNSLFFFLSFVFAFFPGRGKDPFGPLLGSFIAHLAPSIDSSQKFISNGVLFLSVITIFFFLFNFFTAIVINTTLWQKKPLKNKTLLQVYALSTFFSLIPLFLIFYSNQVAK